MQYRTFSTATTPPRLTALPGRLPQASRQLRRTRAILEGLRLRRMPVDIDPPVVTVAEVAECGCPELCNRDHDNE